MSPSSQPYEPDWIRPPPSRIVTKSPRHRIAPDRRKSLILIVDDSADTREIYSACLTHSGYRVLTEPDGALGLHTAITHRPDVIVMDLSMPRLDGIDATRYLKRSHPTRGIPVIMLTGYPFEAINQEVLEAGVDVFLTKPCLPEELERNIRQLLVRKRRSMGAAS
jgi:two-component system, cell cycle response regulator DivK